MKKRNNAIIIALAAVAMLAAGCEKEQTGKTVTLGASMAPNNTKVYIDGYTPKWNEGDQVNVNGTAYSVSNISISGGTADIQGVAEANDFRCVYPSSIVTSGLAAESGTCNVTLPTTQTYAEDNSGNQTVAVPMSGMTSGTNVTFHNLCSVLKVRFTNSTGGSVTLRKVRVTAASSLLSGSGTAQVTGEESDKVTLASGEKYVDLVLGNSGVEVTDGASKDFYIVLPEFTSQNVTIEFVRTDNMQKSLTLSGVSLGHNKLVSKTVTVSNSSDFNTRHMPGVFSVGEGTKVKFSQGNLRATGTTSSTNGSGWTWSFAEHQWDRVGNATANTAISGNGTITTDGTVDLFGWSTSATYYGIHNSETIEDYGGAFVDWGIAYNNANSTSGWRTLSSDEWVYLLNTRSGARYAKAKVYDVNGLIIFPDNSVTVSDNSATFEGFDFTNVNNDKVSYNTISDENWTTLEAAGCVFLPAAGYRFGAGVNLAVDGGYYWSSTPNVGDYAYYVYFYVNTLDAGINSGRDSGRSVRLVQDK